MSGRTFEKFELIKRVLANGRFVLHGSNLDDLRWVEPRPATLYGTGQNDPGVYATEDVATAIFYAVLDRARVRWFAASRGEYVLDLVEGAAAPWAPGAVYVLDRSDFALTDGHWVSMASVRAVGKVAVTIDDFPRLAEVQYQPRAAWLARRGGTE